MAGGFSFFMPCVILTEVDENKPTKMIGINVSGLWPEPEGSYYEKVI